MRWSLLVVVACVVAALGGCSLGSEDAAGDDAALTEDNACGDLGYLPHDPSLTPEQERGRCTWHLFTAGTERLYRPLAVKEHGEIDIMKVVDSRLRLPLSKAQQDQQGITAKSPAKLIMDKTESRSERFKTFGVINDPECTPSSEPDEFGLFWDKCDKDKNATGVIGFRKFPNPKFRKNPALKFGWDIDRYYRDASVEPPYLVGITCGMCHVGLNPVKPAADPENPKWENLHSTMGNHHIKEGSLFAAALPKDDFRRELLRSQPPGTSDTSRISTDHINNPNTIGSILGFKHRPQHEEKQRDGKPAPVYSILKDGADSIGLRGALLRVYVNIGACSEQWLRTHDAIDGSTEQSELDVPNLPKVCKEYAELQTRMPDLEQFLLMQEGDVLRLEKVAPEKIDRSKVERGAKYFAQQCARCHSSKKPGNGQTFEDLVKQPDFLDGNFLSDDHAYSVREIGTNIKRAMGTNAMRGNVWAQYSSEDYKSRPAACPNGEASCAMKLDTPIGPATVEMKPGGQGYYRTPSLINVWASAPYFHNNRLGDFVKEGAVQPNEQDADRRVDASVEGRLKSFQDAIEMLLWPEKRPGKVIVTKKPTFIDIPAPIGRPRISNIPAGTPVDLFGNLDPRRLDFLGGMFGNGGKVFVLGLTLKDQLSDEDKNTLLGLILAPDLVEDHGHEFGTGFDPSKKASDPSLDEDKRALIEYLKTF